MAPRLGRTAVSLRTRPDRKEQHLGRPHQSSPSLPLNLFNPCAGMPTAIPAGCGRQPCRRCQGTPPLLSPSPLSPLPCHPRNWKALGGSMARGRSPPPPPPPPPHPPSSFLPSVRSRPGPPTASSSRLPATRHGGQSHGKFRPIHERHVYVSPLDPAVVLV